MIEGWRLQTSSPLKDKPPPEAIEVFVEVLNAGGLRLNRDRSSINVIWNGRIIEEWKKLPQSIKRELGYDLNNPPAEVFDVLSKVPPEMEFGSVWSLDRAQEPWQAGAAVEKTPEAAMLSSAMTALVQENPDLAWYPRILEMEARLLVEYWNQIDESEQEAIREWYDLRTPKTTIPASFVKTWYRKLITRDEGTKGNGGSDPMGGGGAISGFVPPGETSGSPGAGHIARQGIDEYGNAIISGAEIYSGKILSVIPIMPMPFLATPAFALP